MTEADQFLTPEVILLILLLLIALGMWLQLALLRTRLSSRLTRLEERFHEHDQLLELQAKGGREIAEASDRVVDAMNESRAGLDALRRDVVRLADDVRGEVGMSRAIELARGGATKQAARGSRSHRHLPRPQVSPAHGRGQAASAYMRKLDFVHFTLR